MTSRHVATEVVLKRKSTPQTRYGSAAVRIFARFSPPALIWRLSLRRSSILLVAASGVVSCFAPVSEGPLRCELRRRHRLPCRCHPCLRRLARKGYRVGKRSSAKGLGCAYGCAHQRQRSFYQVRTTLTIAFCSCVHAKGVQFSITWYIRVSEPCYDT